MPSFHRPSNPHRLRALSERPSRPGFLAGCLVLGLSAAGAAPPLAALQPGAPSGAPLQAERIAPATSEEAGPRACEAAMAARHSPRTVRFSGVRSSPPQEGFLLVSGRAEVVGGERPLPRVGGGGEPFACLVLADGSRVLALVPPGGEVELPGAPGAGVGAQGAPGASPPGAARPPSGGGTGVLPGTAPGAAPVTVPPPGLSPARLEACQAAVNRQVEAEEGVRPIHSARPRGETAADGSPQVVGALTIPRTGRAPLSATFRCTLDPATGQVREIRITPDHGPLDP